jgi:hypothetical protein
MVSYCRFHDLYDCWFGHEPHQASHNYQEDHRWISWWGFDEYGCDEQAYPHIAQDGRMAIGGSIYDGRDAITGSWTEYAPPAQQYGFRCSTWIANRVMQELAAVNYTLIDEPF